MSKSASLTNKGQRTRTSILSAAKQVFGRRGYSGARISDIAESAGLSLGAIYRYFKDKDEIFAELFEDLHARFLDATRARTDVVKVADLRDAILLANSSYFELYAAESDFMRAVVEASAVNDRYMARWSAMYTEIADRFQHRLTRAAGRISPSPALDHSVFALVCMTEQVAYVNFTRRSDGPPIDPGQLAAVVTEIWWRAIGAVPEAADWSRQVSTNEGRATAPQEPM